MSIFLQVGLQFTAFFQHQGEPGLGAERSEIVKLKVNLPFFITFPKDKTPLFF